jgi:hypothetical protein
MEMNRETELLRHQLAALLHSAIVEQDMRIEDLSNLTGVDIGRITAALAARRYGKRDLSLSEISLMFRVLNHDLKITAEPTTYPLSYLFSKTGDSDYQLDMFPSGTKE